MCFVHFAKSNFPPKNDPLNIAYEYFGLNATDVEERNMTYKVVSNNICLFFEDSVVVKTKFFRPSSVDVVC